MAAGVPTIQTTFQASVMAKGFLPVELSSFEDPSLKVLTTLLFIEPGFMDILSCKRALELRPLFQILLCPSGDTATMEEGSVEYF